MAKKPLVVERLPNWAAHFRAIKERLSRPPNARPYGTEVYFTPDTEEEYRLVQRYLTSLERVACLGSPTHCQRTKVSKSPSGGYQRTYTLDAIHEELRAMGFQPDQGRTRKTLLRIPRNP